MFSRILQRKNRIYFMITDGFKTSLKKQKHLSGRKRKKILQFFLITWKMMIMITFLKEVTQNLRVKMRM